MWTVNHWTAKGWINIALSILVTATCIEASKIYFTHHNAANVTKSVSKSQIRLCSVFVLFRQFLHIKKVLNINSFKLFLENGETILWKWYPPILVMSKAYIPLCAKIYNSRYNITTNQPHWYFEQYCSKKYGFKKCWNNKY